ncbi:MAG: type II toxin-antitoxin system VapC family toxin [Rhodospirillales bacterium]|nr:type II toxin-antitoxin system VapC family toxin [Rhodospirillales bacterium]
MIILDTNVLSAVMQRVADPVIVAWLDRQPPQSLWLTAITVFEVAFGLHLLAPGRRRDQLEDAFRRAIDDDFEGRVLSFDGDAARESALIAARQRQAGRTVEIRDVQIAGIAAARGASVATRNTRHFEATGIQLINPWNQPA